MSSRHKGRHAVYLGKLPTDYRPESPIDLPDRLSTLEVLEANLTMCQAIALTRHHNREQLAAGIPDSRWAVFAFRPKGGAS